jgi:hypothetical protein
MELKISTGQIMRLIALASKASEFANEFMAGMVYSNKLIELNQVGAAIGDCFDVLGQIDRDNPGICPIPHDGRSWAQRVAEAEAEGEKND